MNHPCPRHAWLAFFSPFGEVGVLWRNAGGRSAVARILAPRPGLTAADRVREVDPEARPGTNAAMDAFARRLCRALAGEAAGLSLDALDLASCAPFARRVLERTFAIPRGAAATYGGLARACGHPGAARAVGAVMAGNPFPLCVPCHRVVRSDGSLGGFGGGLAMKRALLESEGVLFDGRGRVRQECLWPARR